MKPGADCDFRLQNSPSEAAARQDLEDFLKSLPFAPRQIPSHTQSGTPDGITLLDRAATELRVDNELCVDSDSETDDQQSSIGDFVTATPPNLFRIHRHPTNCPVLEPLSSEEHQQKQRVLTTFLVIGINFFLTCGGPNGIEPVVAASGPFIGLLALVVYPLVYSLPVALVVTELCTAFPDDGGLVLWVKNAFGSFWGFQQGYWVWLSNVFGNALYSIAIFSALTSSYGSISSPIVEYAIEAVVAIALSLPTVFGPRFVSRTSILLMVLVLFPFVGYSLSGFASAPASNWKYLGEARYQKKIGGKGDISIDWKKLVGTVFWSYDGVYLVSLFGGQVENPASTYPRTILISLVIAVVTYVIPLAAVTVVGLQNWRNFDENSMTTVANSLGGGFMKTLIVFSTLCSNVGMFSAATFCGSYQLNGMAKAGLLPPTFARRQQHFGTPYVSIMANSVPVLLLLMLDFEMLLDATNAFSALVQMMIILAAVKMRTDIRRPTRVSARLAGLVIAMLVPIGVLCYIVCSAFVNVLSAIVLTSFVGVGALYGWIVFIYRAHRSPDMPAFEAPYAGSVTF